MRIQRSREKEEGDHRGYRTHLIFAGKRDTEGTSGPSGVSQAGSHYFGGNSASATYSSHSNHPFAQGQQFRSHHHDSSLATSRSATEDDFVRSVNKQVSFNPGNTSWASNVPHQAPVSPMAYGEDQGKPGMLEVIAGLSRDCFIIPLACVDRFLPAGLTLPELKSRANNNSSSSSISGIAPLNILEVADPQLAVVVHLMTPLVTTSLPAESTVTQPERIQKALGTQLLQRIASERQAAHGFLMASMETSSDFPVIAMYVVPKLRTDATDFLENARRDALTLFDPAATGHCGDHFFHICREVATIAKPPAENPGKKPGQNPATGYIVSIFRVFEGDDKEKLERNWLYWTGARALYRQLPKSVGLRRITLHKSTMVRGDKLYLLLCECANFLENVNSAAQLLPALRARLCGYTGIYRVVAAF